jgi:hypothetical protein
LLNRVDCTDNNLPLCVVWALSITQLLKRLQELLCTFGKGAGIIHQFSIDRARYVEVSVLLILIKSIVGFVLGYDLCLQTGAHKF